MNLKVAVYIGGEYKGSKLVDTPCFIGRSKEAGLTISHPSVSRKHCELYDEEGKLFLKDNGSLNGTLYKGEFVENPVPVSFGDEFVIGELLIRLESPTDEKVAASPTEIENDDQETVDAAMVTRIDPANVASFDDDGSQDFIGLADDLDK